MRFALAAIALTAVLPLASCTTKEEERKPVGPQTASDPKPWNRQISGQGGGAFGSLPQQPRR